MTTKRFLPTCIIFAAILICSPPALAFSNWLVISPNGEIIAYADTVQPEAVARAEIVELREHGQANVKARIDHRSHKIYLEAKE